jgi:Tol biopolymer transport system component
LLWFDRTGKRLGSAAPPGLYYGVDLSPDGRRAVAGRVDSQSRNIDLWTFEFARGVGTRFTFDPARESQGVWSPDGNRIAFASARGDNGVYQKVASGEGSEELVFSTKVLTLVNSWSPDGRFLLYTAAGKAATDLWMLPLTGDRKPAPYLENQFNKRQAQFSPDGTRVAYTTLESGREEVFVQPFPSAASGGRWQISAEGGEQPRWRRDGKEIFYLDQQRRLMSVEVRSAPGFEARPPRMLFQTQAVRLAGDYTYAVTPDGQRFLINTLGGAEISSTPLTVVLNWQAGLKR